eukprot:COSAG01_NODE_1586_length_9810_cov_3.655442_3_plen_199_part_00
MGHGGVGRGLARQEEGGHGGHAWSSRDTKWDPSTLEGQKENDQLQLRYQLNMEEAEDLLTCARTARAVLARVTASGNDARMRRWRYRQLITYHHDHRQLTDVEFKEQAAQELAMLDYLWTSGATADDYGQFEDRTGIAMDQRLAADVPRGLREARALMDGLRTESRGTPTGNSAPGQRHGTLLLAPAPLLFLAPIELE